MVVLHSLLRISLRASNPRQSGHTAPAPARGPCPSHLRHSYKLLYISPMTIKPAEFLGDTIEILRAFPDKARQDAGFQLDKVQRGEEPDDSKPMPGIGAGVKEIRIWDEAGTFRVIYLARLADAVYVLHCFQKKAQETSQKDIKLARKRYKELMRTQP